MKYPITIISLLFLVLILPGAVLASSLSLDPSTGIFNRSCPFSLNIRLDSAGVEIDGTDAYLIYDNSRFTATTITPGTIFAEYSGSNVDDAAGKVAVSGLAPVPKGFTGNGVLATVNFTVKENAPAGATQIKFDFDANDMSKTTDSNVVQRGTVQETLSSVVNGNYTIGTGNCATVSPNPVGRGAAGSGSVSTPSAQPKEWKTLDEAAGAKAGGNDELTATLAIVGLVLTILGILGLALL